MTYKPKTLTVKISTVRDMTYKKIDALVKDIKDNTSMSDHFISKVDINMKNAINKILNDYRYQEVNKKVGKVEEERKVNKRQERFVIGGEEGENEWWQEAKE